MTRLLSIVGPTAVGKTQHSINLAKIFDCEIISGDSMQVYKLMDIGTAKIQKKEMQDIPHHLIDIIYPDEPFNASIFKKRAEDIIKEIRKRNKIALLVGGTGLYVNGLLYNYKFSHVNHNKEYRLKLEKYEKTHGLGYLYQKLSEIDPEICKKISSNDKVRIIRALEVYHQSSIKFSQMNQMKNPYCSHFDSITFGLNMDRELLYEKINKRVDVMMENGLVDEVKYLLSLGYSNSLTALQAIGYKEIVLALNHEITLTESIEMIKKNSRNFAKRQLTWFRKDPNIIWIDTTYLSEKAVVNEMKNIILNKWSSMKGREI